jgi:hypothetical protein
MQLQIAWVIIRIINPRFKLNANVARAAQDDLPLGAFSKSANRLGGFNRRISDYDFIPLTFVSFWSDGKTIISRLHSIFSQHIICIFFLDVYFRVCSGPEIIIIALHGRRFIQYPPSEGASA